MIIPITWLSRLRFLEERPPSPMRVHTIYEPELLGTAGTLLANHSFFQGSTAF